MGPVVPEARAAGRAGVMVLHESGEHDVSTKGFIPASAWADTMTATGTILSTSPPRVNMGESGNDLHRTFLNQEIG